MVMLFKNNQRTKRKANSNKRCYNYHKFSHFRYNCPLPNKQLNQNTNQNKKRNALQHQVDKVGKSEEESDDEPFASGPVSKVCMAVETLKIVQRTTSNTWFLDLCVFCHLCNNRKRFRSTDTKSINFVTVAGQVIQTNEIGIVAILLSNGKTIELHNVAYAPE